MIPLAGPDTVTQRPMKRSGRVAMARTSVEIALSRVQTGSGAGASAWGAISRKAATRPIMC